MFNLFDAYVLSILNYGCEVCVIINANVLERVQKQMCRFILNVKQSINTLALYAEF
jgi:hypothetical protein